MPALSLLNIQKKNMVKILFIEDDLNLGTIVTDALELQNYEVCYLSDANKALETFHRFQPELLITDVMLNASIDGFDLAKTIRSISNIPILFTTSKDSSTDIKTGLGMGNSDFIRKPYRFIELSMRVENILARQSFTTTIATNAIGQYQFDAANCTLKHEAEAIELSKYEASVLQLLADNRNCFVSRKEIVEKIWNETDPKSKEASLNNILSHLRKYLSRDPHIGLESKINTGVKLSIDQ